MGSLTRETTDHAEIRRWIEQRGGRPTTVRGRGGEGVIGIGFDGPTDDDLSEEISWEDFFATFDRERLTFSYEEESREDRQSRFFKLVRR